MENIFLIGMRGSGKSVVGKLLSEKTGKSFRDLDKEMVQREGKSIPKIVEVGGWDAFRQKEKDILREACSGTDQVIGTGGGAVMFFDNGERMKESGRVIFLFAEPKTLGERLLGEMGERPSLTDKPFSEEIQKIWEERKDQYQELSDLTINTEQRTPSEVVEQILMQFDLS